MKPDASKLPKKVREAYEFAERWDPAGIFKEWRNEQMVEFLAWQEREARFTWRMKWIGVPALAIVFGVWAWAMIYYWPQR